MTYGNLNTGPLTVSINECKYTGNIYGNNCGGICGNYFGNIKTNQNSMNEFTSSVVYTVSNCISKCNIYGLKSGGILASNALNLGNHNSGNNYNSNTKSLLNLIDCVHDGNIYSELCGGIVANSFGVLHGTQNSSDNKFSATISNCIHHGSISNIIQGSRESAGIVGVDVSSPMTIMNCYSTGHIYGACDGICGSTSSPAPSAPTITNCYSTGYLDTGAYGICKSGAVTISNCYSRDTTIATGGQSLSIIKGRHQHNLSSSVWKNVKHSYPILKELRSYPWTEKDYNKYLDVASLQ